MHRYPTRFQSRKNASPLADMAAWQVTLLDELLPIRLEDAITNQVKLHERGSVRMEEQSLKEAHYILGAIDKMRSRHIHESIADHMHYAIIYRLRADIDLFTYIKYNHTLFERFLHLSKAYSTYYWHAANDAERLVQQMKEADDVSSKEKMIQYHTLLETWKQVIHETNVQFVFKNILRY